MESELVLPVRIRECSVHMEARVRAMHEIGGKRVQQLGSGCC